VRVMHSLIFPAYQRTIDWTDAWAPESRLLDPAVAIGSGYSESKWVAESVLAEAAGRTPLRPVIVRVGQMSGGCNGCWNTNEWVPSIVKSGKVLGCLPRTRGVGVRHKRSGSVAHR
jgi:thioester reductase-like protein